MRRALTSSTSAPATTWRSAATASCAKMTSINDRARCPSTCSSNSRCHNNDVARLGRIDDDSGRAGGWLAGRSKVWLVNAADRRPQRRRRPRHDQAYADVAQSLTPRCDAFERCRGDGESAADNTRLFVGPLASASPLCSLVGANGRLVDRRRWPRK